MGKTDGGIHTTNWPFLLKDLRGKGIILSLRTWRPDLEQVAYVLLLVLLPRLGFSKLLGSYAKNLNDTQIEKQQTLFKESSGNTARDLRAPGGTVSNNSSYHLGYHLGSSYGLQEEEEMVAECHRWAGSQFWLADWVMHVFLFLGCPFLWCNLFKKSYALRIMHRRKLVSRENFPQKFTHRTVCSTTHSPQISPAQSSPVSIVTRYIFQNMLDHKRSYPEAVKGGALSGVGHMYSSMQVQVSDH